MQIGSYLGKIRTPDKTSLNKKGISHPIAFFIFGIMLGVFSKWLDTLSYNDFIPWQHFLGYFDLGNIFSEFPVWVLFAIVIAVYSKTPRRAAESVLLFFVGMTTSYHIYTVYVCGFNPKSYMMIWYAITLLSPIPAILCWYAKGNGKAALCLKVLILTFMMRFTFYVGVWYFSFGRTANLLFLAAVIAVLWKGWKDAAITFGMAFLLRFLISLFFYI